MRVSSAGMLRRSGALWRTLVEYVLFLASLALFGLTTVVWTLVASALCHAMPRRMGARVGQFAIMVGFRGFVGAMRMIGLFRCDLSALDALRHERGLVIVANHPSLLDAVLVISRLPGVVCITKAALWDNLLLGGSIRLACYIRNDAPVTLVKLAVHELRSGHQLLVFPEGTRTGDPPVDRFKPGFVAMARRAGVPIQTVFLEGGARYLGKGWPLFRKPEFPLVYRARLGRRFDVPPGIRTFTEDLEHYYREELQRPHAAAAASPA
jgi:1-acyl-sn-glycerol-3-phosphate acyltransferase